MLRHKGVFLLLAMGVCGSAIAQSPVWVASTATSDPNFVSYYTTIHGFPNGPDGAEMDMTLNQIYGQIGQEFPSPKNWSTNNGFALSIENTESFPISMGFLVKNSAGGQVLSIFEVPANQRVKFYVDNSGFSTQSTGMDRPLPVFDGTYKHSLVFSPQSLQSVKSWNLYYRGNTPARVRVSNVVGHLVDLNYPNFVNQYGQLSYLNWAGKPVEDLDLVQENEREINELNASPGGSETMGSSTLGSVTATGKWRTIKGRNGKWYIATPAGKLFWSVGITGVSNYTTNQTIIDGRENMFQDLPATGTPEADFYGTVVKNGVTLKTYNYSGVNLLRKYGTSYEAAWQSRAASRVKSWGVNTLGSGSDLRVMENYNVPGVLTITTKDFPSRLPTPFAYWGTLPDPYNTAFPTWIANRYRSMLLSYCQGKRLMGIYVDGENAWMGADSSSASRYQIPLAALRMQKTQPSKQVLLAQLRTKYPTIGHLNSAWRTNFGSWSYMYDNQLELNTNFTQAQLDDFSKFLSSFAAKYYHGVRSALTEIGINCLFMGSKDSATWTPPEVHVQAAKYCDVISMTYYGRVDQIDWTYLNSLKKPVLLAEYTFASNNRGPSASTNWIGELQYDPARRAAETQAYLTQALASPNIVGAHWYAYQDGVVSGRSADLQNYSVGMVDITDRPYEEMVSVFRGFTSGMYSQRGFW